MQTNEKWDWREEFDKEFLPSTGLVHSPQTEWLIEYALKVRSFIQKVRDEAEKKERGRVLQILTDEISIAHTKNAGGITSRLTSAWSKVANISPSQDDSNKDNV